MRTLAFLLLCLCSLAVMPAQAATHSFTESSFHPDDVNSYSIWTSGAVQNATRTGIGNPSPGLSVFTDGAGGTRTAHLFTNMVYDFAGGAMTSLSFQFEYLNLRTYGEGQGYGLLMVQAGQTYAITGVTGPFTRWNSRGFLDVVPSDFVRLQDGRTDSGPAFQPDFGYNAPVAAFGLLTYNASGNGIHVVYDNIVLTLQTVPPPAQVPLPASALMLLLGCFALMAIRRAIDAPIP